jgi:O-antigen ligase
MLFRLSKVLLYATALTVALVSTSTLFPFIVGKYTYFRVLVDLALIAFLAGLMLNPRTGAGYIARLKELFRSPLVIAVTAFTAVFFLAAFFGVRPAFSFWSNFERGEGGLQILHLYALFILLATLFREDADWRKLFWASMAAAGLAILYGVLAGAGLSIGSWGAIGQEFGDPGFRFSGSIGNSAYVAGYLIFTLFFAAYLFLDGGAPGGARRSLRSRTSLGLVGIMLVFLIFAFMSGTRGALFGISAGGFVALAYAAFYRKAWRKWLLAAAAVIVIALASLFFFRQTDFVQSLPGGRLFNFTLEDRDVADRLTMWGIAVEGWQERPLLGWGPENFLMVFDRHFDPGHFHPDSGFGAWFDRAHSVVFDYLATTGILGLLAYLSMFASLFWMLVSRRSREAARNNPRRLAVQALILGVVAAYLVQGLVLFDVLALYLPLFTLLAFAVWYLPQPGGSSAPAGARREREAGAKNNTAQNNREQNPGS